MSQHDLSALTIQRDDDDPARPRPLRRLLIWVAALVPIAVGGWVLWRSDWLPRSAPEVRITRPRVLQAGGVEEILAATGYIVPQLRAVVSARTSGRLDWLGVDEGSRVKRGDVIARLSADDLTALVAEARAAHAQSRATLAQAGSTDWETAREVERQRRLLADGITTESAYDAARRAADVARAGVTAAAEAVNLAEARLRLAEANLDKTIIRAPFDGVVIAKTAEIGEMIAAGAFSGQPTGGAIVTLADFSTLEMEADINESNVSRVREGQPALVTVDAVSGHRYRGVLRQIVPTADRQRAVVVAKVKLLDPDERLVPDMSARVAFLTTPLSAESAAAPPRIFVAASAIRMDGGSPYVLTIKEEKVARVGVSLGEARGDLREVTSGLTGSETLIDSGAEGLRPGDRVRASS